METLLLPGMNGTGQLLVDVAEQLAPVLTPRIVSYPTHELRSYDELLEEITIPEAPFAIVAESFSGPLAVRLAARHADSTCALVLAASFVRNPAPLMWWMQPFARRGLLAVRMPDFALRWGLLGMDASDEQIRALRRALELVDPSVLAHRVRQIVGVDVSAALTELDVPLLYIAGAHDRLVRPRSLEEIQRLRPDVETVLLDAPHLVLQRRPVDAARHISRFVIESASSAR